MSSSFPLLSLPLLAQLEVLDRLNLSEIVTFSLLSKRTAAIAREQRHSIQSVTWEFKNDVSRIGLESVNGSHEILVSGPLENMRRLTEHIYSVFRMRAAFAYLTFSQSSGLADLFLWNYTKDFLSVTLAHQAQIPGCELRFALEHLQMTSLSIEQCVEHGFEYSGPLNVEYLTDDTERSGWLKLEALASMDCRRVAIPSVHLTGADLKEMVRTWQKGGLDNLEYFIADVHYGMDVLDGLDTFPWNPKNRPQHWESVNVSGEDYVDVRRDDGTIATIDTLLFTFRVWKPEFLS